MQSTNGNKFHEIVERDEKKVPTASATDLAIKLLVVVPIWTVLVLPLTIVYQLGSSVLGGSTSTSSTTTSDEPSSSEVDIDVDPTTKTNTYTYTPPSDLIPRPDRKYDVVLLGATGFTGGLAVRHLAKTYNTNTNTNTNTNSTVKWAIAGRSRSKLVAVLQKLADELDLPELVSDGFLENNVVVCDTSDATTLPGLVGNTRAVATTAGPFSSYGEPVVEFCARYGTHYSDITGETTFVKKMKSKHQHTAMQSGARILSLCGNDCVPWDLSYNLLADEFGASSASASTSASSTSDIETMESVEFGNEFSSSASGGTLKTMCMGISGRLATVDASDETILRRTSGFGAGNDKEHTAPMENKISFGIKRGVPKPWKMNESDDNGVVEAPFVMSGVNYEAVGWSHALRRDSKCSYKEQLLLPDFKTALDSVLGLALFFTTLMNPITGGLLENYLVTQPGDGPGLKEMQEDYFLAVTGTARGSKGSIVQSLLYYDKDPGYLETARMVVECALCLALEEEAVSNNIAEATASDSHDKNKDKDTAVVGGFFTPGFALRKNLLKRLVDTGCHYEVRVVRDASPKRTTTA